MNKERELELVLEQCEEVVSRKIPLLVLAPEYTKILLDYIKELKEQYCERTDCSGRLGNSKKVEELIKENEKLNHYKLLYQKVKDRNDKAIEYLGSKKYFEFNYNPECPWDWEQSQKDLLEILKGEENE